MQFQHNEAANYLNHKNLFVQKMNENDINSARYV